MENAPSFDSLPQKLAHNRQNLLIQFPLRPKTPKNDTCINEISVVREKLGFLPMGGRGFPVVWVE